MASARAEDERKRSSLPWTGRRTSPGIRARTFALTRSTDLVQSIVERLPSKDVERIARPETTRYEVLMTLAENEAMRSGDPLAAARLRGIEAQRRLVERAGPLVSAAQLGKALGITPAAIHQRYKKHHLLAVKQGRNLAYPMVQLDGAGVVRGLPEVLLALAENDIDPWSQLRFLVGSSTRAGGISAIAALKAGRVDAVLRAAHQFGEHGAP